MPLARGRRLGKRVVPAAVLAATALLACEQPVGLTNPTPTVSSLAVSPRAITLLPNQVADFMAVGVTFHGETSQMSVAGGGAGGAISDTALPSGRAHRRDRNR